jgi:2-iminobutanoate/2-iminopropanoate deaminase
VTAFRTFSPEGMYRPKSYAHALLAGDTLYIAGQVARDAEGTLVGPGDAARQAAQVFDNLERVLREAGAGFGDLVKLTTYLVDPADGEAVAAERLKRLGDHRPPHTGLVVKALGGPEVLVEVEGVAVLSAPR